MFMRVSSIHSLLLFTMVFWGDSPQIHPHSPQFPPQFFGSFVRAEFEPKSTPRTDALQEAFRRSSPPFSRHTSCTPSDTRL